ncbi:MAG: hypothetical protein CM1200mP6_06760 [Anaerolineaceae bacterium]|nr:MAG: hypothetical protein CM1200mP6_06760 [Anaerolineaceae bacterium]
MVEAHALVSTPGIMDLAIKAKALTEDAGDAKP